MDNNEVNSLDAVEMEIKARYNGKYTSAPEYQASERETRKAITDIFKNVAELGSVAKTTGGQLLLIFWITRIT